VAQRHRHQRVSSSWAPIAIPDHRRDPGCRRPPRSACGGPGVATRGNDFSSAIRPPPNAASDNDESGTKSLGHWGVRGSPAPTTSARGRSARGPSTRVRQRGTGAGAPRPTSSSHHFLHPLDGIAATRCSRRSPTPRAARHRRGHNRFVEPSSAARVFVCPAQLTAGASGASSAPPRDLGARSVRPAHS